MNNNTIIVICIILNILLISSCSDNAEIEVMSLEEATGLHGYHPDSSFSKSFASLDESFSSRREFESSRIYKELSEQWIDKTLYRTYLDDKYWVICNGVTGFDGSFLWYFVLPYYADIIVYDYRNDSIVVRKRFLGYMSYNAVIIKDHVYFLIPERGKGLESAQVGRFPIR